ncbi:hypothetical protein HZB78_04855 [Candidatus Collierbacteria bacterium]|nr:hypothetical protein [Candidatus Collierbacteria bacterium]
MNWEFFERIGLVLMLLGFGIVGWLQWGSVSQNAEVLRRLALVEQRLDSVIKSSLTVNREPLTVTDKCDEECVKRLVSDAIATISGISQPAKQQVIERVVEKVQTVSGSSAKTQYVSLGGGETTSSEWVTLPGAEVTFNISDFGKISAVYFEAQLQSGSGKVFARLYVKDSGAVPDSEILHVAGDAKLISRQVNISGGGKTIGVQLKSEIQQPVKVLSSRLRIDTK